MSSRYFIPTVCLLGFGILLVYGFQRDSHTEAVPIPPSSSTQTDIEKPASVVTASVPTPNEFDTPEFQKVIQSLCRKSGYQQDAIERLIVNVKEQLHKEGKEEMLYEVACHLDDCMIEGEKLDIAQVAGLYVVMSKPVR